MPIVGPAFVIGAGSPDEVDEHLRAAATPVRDAFWSVL